MRPGVCLALLHLLLINSRLGGQGGGGGGWISALQVTRACVCSSQTVPFQLTVHSEMVMAALSARGMLLNGDLQHQEWALGNWGG